MCCNVILASVDDNGDPGLSLPDNVSSLKSRSMPVGHDMIITYKKLFCTGYTLLLKKISCNCKTNPGITKAKIEIKT